MNEAMTEPRRYLSQRGHDTVEAELRHQLHEAAEEVRQLKVQLRQLTAPTDPVYETLDLTFAERFVLNMIVHSKGTANGDRIFSAWQFERTLKNCGEPTQAKSLNVIMCRLRKKLTPRGIVIETIFGVGFVMSADNKARLAAFDLNTSGD